MANLYESDELVEQYEAYRPTYPVEVVTEVLKFLDEQNPGEKRRGFMLDVGCGGGQATRMFAPYFQNVLGIDVSASQIKFAKKTVRNVEFRIGSASDFPVESESVDLVIAGTAAHYFELNAFLSECDRSLRPGGGVALFCYWARKLKTLQGNPIEASTGYSEIYNVLKRYAEEIGLSDYMINVLLELYKPIFDRINKPCKRLVTEIEWERQLTVDEYISELGTVAEYRANKDRFGDVDPLETARSRIEALLGITDENRTDKSAFTINYAYPIVLFRK